MPLSVTISILLAGSVFLVIISWKSLCHPDSHGFFRFFAFEAVFFAVVLNVPAWFVDPFSPLHLVSWVLLCLSAGLVIHSVILLKREGRSTSPQQGSPLFRFENTGRLVTSGIYRLIRHPMYASLLYLGWGAALKSLSPASLALALIATGALVATAKREEVENVTRFGDEYRVYMTRTRLFIPFVF